MDARRRLAAAAVVALACGSVAACSGDDDSSSSTGGTRTTTTTRATEPAGLAEVIARQDRAVIKVTYQRGNTTFTVAQDHDSHAITADTSMSIVTPRQSVDCTDLDTTPQCLEVPKGVSSLVNTGLLFYDAAGQGLVEAAHAQPPLRTTSERVAGRPATCAVGDASTFLAPVESKVGSIPDAKVRACVDTATGYLLEFKGSDPDDTLVATSVTEPTAADFRPPAKVQRIGQ